MSHLYPPRILVFHGMYENADEYLINATRAWPLSIVAVVQMNRSTMGDWRTATPLARTAARTAINQFRPDILWGHSAGAQFLSRFLCTDDQFLASSSVRKVVLNNAGSYAMPTSDPNATLPYNCPYNASQRNILPEVQVRVGENDDDTNQLWTDYFEVYAQGKTRWERARRFYNAWNVTRNTNISIEHVPNIGHTHGDMMKTWSLY